jgi:lambda family phage tail tape measure protein
MADSTIDLKVNNAQAITALKQIESQVSKLNTSFAGLRNILSGLALGTIITNTIRFADSIQDVSDATNIAVTNVLQFSRAVEESGGNSQKANDAILNLTKNIGNANSGSNEAQKAFRLLGITLEDLRNLSEREILEKTITGLSNIDDASKRAALSSKVLGDNIKGVNLANLATAYSAAGVGASNFSSAVRAAAELQGKLDSAFMRLQESILKALEPLIKFINAIDDKTIAGLINAIVQLGAAAAVFAAFGAAVRTTATFINGMASAIGTLLGSIGGLVIIATGVVGIFKTLQITVSVLAKYAFPAWITAVKSGSGLLTQMGITVATLGKRFSFLIKDLGLIVGAFVTLILPLGRIIALVYLLSDAIKQLSEGKTFGDVIDDWAARLEKFVSESFPRMAKAINWLGEKLGMGLAPSVGVGGGRGAGIGGATAEEMKKFYDVKPVKAASEETLKLRREIDQIAKNYQDINNDIYSALNLQTQMVGKSEDEQQIMQAIYNTNARINDQIKDLLNKRAEWANGTEEQRANLGLIDNLIKQIRATQQGVVDSVVKGTMELQTANILEKDRLRLLELMSEQYDKQAQRAQSLADILRGTREQMNDLKFERGQMTEGPIEQQINRAYEDMRKNALEAQRQFAESFGDTGDGMTPERMAELQRGLDEIAFAFRQIARETESNILISQQWKTGWESALNSFRDNAMNAADRAREVFTIFTSNVESALDNMVRTGKLGFKDLVRSIILDLTSSALKQAFRNLFLMTNSNGTGSFLATVGSWFAGFFANGGYIPPGKAGIVGEAGPELVSGPANVTPMGQLGGGSVNNYYTYNISAIDSRSVAQFFAENRRTMLGATEQARKELPIRQRF